MSLRRSVSSLRTSPEKLLGSLRSCVSLRPTVAREGGGSCRALHSLATSAAISSTVTFSESFQRRLAVSRIVKSTSDGNSEEPVFIPRFLLSRAVKSLSFRYRSIRRHTVARETPHFF